MAYANPAQRVHDLKRAHHLYEPHEPYGPYVCVYCGDPATTRDHVVPVSYVASLGDMLEQQMPRLRRGLITVPACFDCNSRLSGFFALSMSAKRTELKSRLRRRWRRLLGSYDWQPAELAELGYNLRTKFSAAERKRLAVLERLAFPKPGEAKLRRDIASLSEPEPKKAPRRPVGHAPVAAWGSGGGVGLSLPGGWRRMGFYGPAITYSPARQVSARKSPAGPDWASLADAEPSAQLSLLPVLDAFC